MKVSRAQAEKIASVIKGKLDDKEGKPKVDLTKLAKELAERRERVLSQDA